MPEYDLSDHKVKVTITGKVLDSNYARKLAEDKTLSLFETMILDKVQKNKKLTNEEYKLLKSKNLIEGKRNHYFISSTVAEITNQKPDYIPQLFKFIQIVMAANKNETKCKYYCNF